MNTTKHTPGPWVWKPLTRLDNNDNDVPVQNVFKELESEVIQYYRCGSHAIKVSEANAHLIAAAPELLMVLQQIADDHNDGHGLTGATAEKISALGERRDRQSSRLESRRRKVVTVNHNEAPIQGPHVTIIGEQSVGIRSPQLCYHWCPSPRHIGSREWAHVVSSKKSSTDSWRRRCSKCRHPKG